MAREDTRVAQKDANIKPRTISRMIIFYTCILPFVPSLGRSQLDGHLCRINAINAAIYGNVVGSFWSYGTELTYGGGFRYSW